MPTIFLRIFLIYNLVLDYLVPKKLKSFLSRSRVNNPTPHASTLVSAGGQIGTHADTGAASPHCCRKRMNGTELKKIFQMFDKNGDGAITKKELNDSLENMGIFISDGDLTQMIERIDVNGDMCIDIDEFSELYQTMMDSKDEEEDMKEAFNVFDRNGDGYISVDELRSVLESLGLKQGKAMEDCKRMITKVDVDGDGRVNFMEFKQMMKGGGFSAMA
ncbi:multicopy suppressors of snf4 deficiency in yeast 3 [Hibiscus trionum]|uniref:Multicopy suppressors of snf4 deficiency in yeast 3 n=1 Tax=Hibiscus trionum TaxID=183268 RepID=A0A9W7IBB4_HIBTR|nr:multicopy suppressors of snf4 deficiency in yeast 3 [Hibiscus trionum]